MVIVCSCLVLVCPAAVATKAPRVADKQVIVGAAGDDAGERFCRPGILDRSALLFSNWES